ncbi:MAG TPA: hypothetical protein VFW47_07230 [Phenylobacterium sp.]|nr:hypothetical protein [Phenylobacterium sp.]
MPPSDSPGRSALDHRKMALARNLLVPPRPSQKVWPVVTAAAFAAFTALALATATILVPPVVSEPVAKTQR